MTSSCSTNLPSTSFSATCSHEAEMNGENFAKLGFCHSHDHYAFVYIRRFNPLIHSQFLLTLVSTCFDYVRHDCFTTPRNCILKVHRYLSNVPFECYYTFQNFAPFHKEGKSCTTQATGKVQTTISVRICVRPQLIYLIIYEFLFFYIFLLIKFSQ